MKIKYITFIFLLISAYSCKQKDLNKIVEITNDSITNIKYTDVNNVTIPSKSTEEYIAEIEKRQSDMKEKLKNIKGEEANNLLSEYHKILTGLLDSLSITEKNTLDNYANWKKSNHFPDSINNKISSFKKIAVFLKQDEISEKYRLDYVPGYFYEQFKDKVTPDVRDFLKFRTEEKLNPYIKNNLLIVSQEDLRNRTLYWENYIKKYPNTKFYDIAKKAYVSHLITYLFGTEKKTNINITGKSLHSETEQEFLLLIRQHPESKTAKITKSFMEYFLANQSNFKSNELIEQVKERTKAEIEKIIANQ